MIPALNKTKIEALGFRLCDNRKYKAMRTATGRQINLHTGTGADGRAYQQYVHPDGHILLVPVG